MICLVAGGLILTGLQELIYFLRNRSIKKRSGVEVSCVL